MAARLFAALALAAGAAGENATLVGAGSSLLCPLMKVWTPMYEAATGVALSYECTGSGTGKQRLLAGEGDFAGSDSLFSDEQHKAHPDLQMIPMVAEAVAVVFSLPGVDDLVLGRETVGQIFDGHIQYWDDVSIARWNPTLQMPHERIQVHVRAGSSGTTELFTSALLAFGSWNATRGATSTWYTDEELPEPSIDIARVNSSSTMIKTVLETPYSIGYSGLTGVVKSRAAYAALVNRAGQVVYPGRHAGTDNLGTLSLDADRLTGSMVDGLGYPIAGVSYLAVRKDSSPKACAAVRFAMWVLQGGAGLHEGGEAGVYRLFGEISTPLPADRVNTILHKVLLSTCGPHQGGPRRLMTLDVSFPGLAAPLRDTGYAYHVDHDPSSAVSINAATSNATHGTNQVKALHLPHLRVIDATEPPPPGTTAFPLAIGTLVLATRIGLSGGLRSITADLGTIRSLLRGDVASWDHPSFANKNEFINTVPVEWAGLHGLEVHRQVIAHLGMGGNSTVVPERLFTDSNSLAQYVAQTPGAIAVMSPAVAAAWKLVTIIPTIDGNPLTPSMATLGKQFRRIASSTGKWPWEVPGIRDEVYPFFTVAAVAVPTDLTTAGYVESGWTCEDAAAALYPYLRWVVMDSTAAARLRGFEYMVAAPIVEAAEGWGDMWTGLRCGQDRPFPAEGSDDDVTMFTIVAAAAVVVLLMVWLCVRNVMQRRERNEMSGAAAQVTEVAEAVAVLNFDGVEEKFEGLDPEALDRTQSAMLKISSMLQEFVKYIPQQVLVAARGREDDDHDDDADGHDTGDIDDAFDELDGQWGGSVHNSDSTDARTTNDSTDSLGRCARGLGLECTVQPVGVLTLRPGMGSILSLDVIVDAQHEFLSLALQCIAQEKGVLHRIAEDHVAAAWGTTRRLGLTAKRNMLRCAVSVMDKSSRGVMTHAGIVILPSVVGALGNENSQTFHILGGACEESNCLAKVGQVTGAPILMPTDVAESLYGCGLICTEFFKVRSPAGRDVATSMLLTYQDAGVNLGEEWMYEIDDATEGDEDTQRVLLALKASVNDGTPDELMGALEDVPMSTLRLPPHHDRCVRWLYAAAASLTAGGTVMPILDPASGSGTVYSVADGIAGGATPAVSVGSMSSLSGHRVTRRRLRGVVMSSGSLGKKIRRRSLSSTSLRQSNDSTPPSPEVSLRDTQGAKTRSTDEPSVFFHQHPSPHQRAALRQPAVNNTYIASP